MRETTLACLGLLVTLGLTAQEKPAYDAAEAALGSSLFKTYCASCHGKGGGGDGPLAESLRFRPPDLTQLARRNKGPFPMDQVRRTIDGRTAVKGHGGPDMPVWGDAFKATSEGYDEKKVAERINQLAHFLASIQVPAN